MEHQSSCNGLCIRANVFDYWLRESRDRLCSQQGIRLPAKQQPWAKRTYLKKQKEKGKRQKNRQRLKWKYALRECKWDRGICRAAEHSGGISNRASVAVKEVKAMEGGWGGRAPLSLFNRHSCTTFSCFSIHPQLPLSTQPKPQRSSSLESTLCLLYVSQTAVALKKTLIACKSIQEEPNIPDWQLHRLIEVYEYLKGVDCMW